MVGDTIGDGDPEDSAAETAEIDENGLAERFKDLCQYYGVWEAPPNAELRTPFILNELVPKIEYSQILQSLHIRGIVVQVSEKHCFYLNHIVIMCFHFTGRYQVGTNARAV